MIDIASEMREAGLKEPPLFQNWSPYEATKVVPQLPSHIKRYVAPKPNDDLRKRIKPIENKLNYTEKSCLRPCLYFLEGGIVEDDFGRKERERDALLLAQKIVINKEEMPLHQFVKDVNKMSGLPILRVITAGQLIGDNGLSTRAFELSQKIEAIKKERGCFLESDLGQVDDLAKAIVEHILQQQNTPVPPPHP